MYFWTDGYLANPAKLLSVCSAVLVLVGYLRV